eukprot:6468279-Amphidinium_carterae.1
MRLAQEQDVVYPSDDEVASVCVPSCNTLSSPYGCHNPKVALWPRFPKAEYVTPEIDTDRIAATDDLIPRGLCFHLRPILPFQLCQYCRSAQVQRSQ